jgi:hypothetical protein
MRFIFRAKFLEPLRGKDLVCYCKLCQPCHADIIMEYFNGEKHWKEVFSLDEDQLLAIEGRILQDSLKARKFYEGKSSKELLEKVKLQMFLHAHSSIDSGDDLEWRVSEGILLERGFSFWLFRGWWFHIIKSGEHVEL